MIFSELYKKSRSKHQPPLVVPAAQPSQYDADLVSRDKTKQKEAVKRYLAEKVRNDWSFQWPPAVVAPPVAVAEPTPAPPAEPAAPAAVLPPPPPSVEGEVLLASDVIDPGLIPVSDQPSSVETAVPAAAATPAANEAPPPLVDAAAGSADPRADEPIDSGAEADSDSESVYSVVSEDPVRYRPRAEWTSDMSDDDEARGPTVSPSPFRFDTPDSVGAVIQASVQTRRAKRRRATRDEASWNEGLACFTARRDAWTGARTVRLKPKPPVSPRSPASPRRSLWRFRSRDGGSHGHSDAVVLSSPTATTATSPGTATASTLPLSPTSPASSALPHNALHLQHIAGGVDTITPPASDGDSHTSSKSPATAFSAPPGPAPSQAAAAAAAAAAGPATVATASPLASTYPVETVVPIPAPLLPPANAMRASITPAIYLSIYDKVVSHSLQPSCPINLVDMMRSCVAGWKRDGEWPPRSAAPPMMDFVSTAAVAAGGGPFISSAASAAAAVRSRRRREREEEEQAAAARRRRERRDSAVTAGGGSRRMSFAGLIGRVSSNDGGGGEEGTSPSSPKGIRKSIQRVLGLGQHGHGHSQSVSSVGSPPPPQ
ncbi:hypothetical protein RB595_005311 [Gaeumannomyces hyphopodioides]